jgi:hypothetical protein
LNNETQIPKKRGYVLGDFERVLKKIRIFKYMTKNLFCTVLINRSKQISPRLVNLERGKLGTKEWIVYGGEKILIYFLKRKKTC